MAEIRFRWLGVAGVELTCRGRTLVTDPFFTRPPFWRLWLGRVMPDAALAQRHVPQADAVLVSHAHYDHVMDVPAVLRHTGAAAYGPPNACSLIALHGIPAEQIHRIAAGDVLKLDPFRVTVIAGVHLQLPAYKAGKLASGLKPPLRLRDYRMDDSFCFLYEVDGLRILDWRGETTAGACPAEVLLFPPFREDEFFVELLAKVQPRLAMPNHWDDFWRPLSQPVMPTWLPPRWGIPPLRRADLADILRQLKRVDAGLQVFVPEMFASYDLSVMLAET